MMKLSVDITFDQLLAFIKQLPVTYKEKLFEEVKKDISESPKEKSANAFQKLLLTGPTWGKEESRLVEMARSGVNKIGQNDPS